MAAEHYRTEQRRPLYDLSEGADSSHNRTDGGTLERP
ncbi:hypothetical protein BIW11_08178 [Tropilaelaps mercedesae]|uniref:Uncharacterized protein n=1 Tax=Tropilaelaps mercedesae TaxID=418985 RepID=A0A1V9XQN2_9ACAR|nr:hypothetical protein BIW11_08178 [Tropilaelaps mercedesae]